MTRILKFLILGTGLLSIVGGIVLLCSLVLPHCVFIIGGYLPDLLRALGLSSSLILCILSFTQVGIGAVLLWFGWNTAEFRKPLLVPPFLLAAALLYFSVSPAFWLAIILLFVSIILILVTGFRENDVEKQQDLKDPDGK